MLRFNCTQKVPQRNYRWTWWKEDCMVYMVRLRQVFWSRRKGLRLTIHNFSFSLLLINNFIAIIDACITSPLLSSSRQSCQSQGRAGPTPCLNSIVRLSLLGVHMAKHHADLTQRNAESTRTVAKKRSPKKPRPNEAEQFKKLIFLFLKRSI